MKKAEDASVHMRTVAHDPVGQGNTDQTECFDKSNVTVA